MAIHPSLEVQQRLEALARETGRSTGQVAREAIFQHIDAIEEYYLRGGKPNGDEITPYGAEPGVDLGL